MDTLNFVRAFGSYSQLSRFVHFLQNQLACDVVVLTSLCIRTAQVLIHVMLPATGYRLPVCD